jgi:hypothetical protein
VDGEAESREARRVIEGITIATMLGADGRVMQDIFWSNGDPVDKEFRRRVIDVADRLVEEKIRECLIALGWTPPPDQPPSA